MLKIFKLNEGKDDIQGGSMKEAGWKGLNDVFRGVLSQFHKTEQKSQSNPRDIEHTITAIEALVTSLFPIGYQQN